MEGKNINKLKIFSIFITTTFIFSVGIFFGNIISNSQLDRISNLQQDLRTQTLSLELQYALAGQKPCNLTNLDIIGDELYDMSELLANMEGSLGKLNSDVLSLKEYYSLLEIKHWLFLEKVSKECNVNIPIILYFYSNLGDCDECERQGYILTYLKRSEENLNVFSFDANIDNSVLNGLKEINKVRDKKLPVLVINGEVYDGFMELEKIKENL